MTVQDLVKTLGTSVLRLVAAPAGTEAEVADVVLWDATDPPAITPGTLVLGIGLFPGRELRELMERVVAEGALLVVKAAPAADAELGAEARATGATVLATAPGAAWLQIASLLRSAVGGVTAPDGEELGGVAAGDLFAVANAVAAVIDAPVTIEDPRSRVIAYSARQAEADEARMITILGRQVPDQYRRKFEAEGLFRKLYRQEGAIYLEDIGPGVLPRLAVAVRAGDEVLGSIWAAVKQRPRPEQEEEFANTAKIVAVHLLRHRLASDVQRGLQADLLSAILNGGPLAPDAASRLGLAGDAFRVLAVGFRTGDAIDNEVLLLRSWDTLALHLSVGHRRAVTGLLGGVVYAVVPGPGEPDASRRMARQAVEGFLARLPAGLREQVVVGVGGHARELADVPRSRQDADRALMVMRGQDVAGGVVGEIEDMHMQVLLMRLAEMTSAEDVPAGGPLEALVEHDATHNTRFVETLRAYLDAFGDVALAAGRLNIHHNTLRYRLQKLKEVPGVSLDDADQRLALQLQLRLFSGSIESHRPRR